MSTRPPDVDCAAALDLTINQMMASLALQVVRRMVAGTCPFMGLYLDMEQGTVSPTYATPEAVERVVRSDSDERERRPDGQGMTLASCLMRMKRKQPAQMP